MIAFRQLALQRGTRQLFAGADLVLHEGQKVGIVGANGAGKSSLFALIRGELGADAGSVEIAGGKRIAHMAQEVSAIDRPLVEYVLDGDVGLRETETALAEAQANGEMQREAVLHGEIEALDGYSARSRAEQLLAGLGFGQDDLYRPLADFSGGWRMRVGLARTLFTPSEIMLLDEPTNHLDLDALLWLEQWLTRYPGTLMLISHDRDFLDAVCDHILHIDQGQLMLYRGHYSAFERARAERQTQQQAAYEKQQARRAEIEGFVARFRAQATKARQAQSRLKMLERMENIAAARVDSPFRFQLPCADKTSTPLLSLDQASLGYPDRTILDGVKVSILPGERIGLLGPNGAGKSTLIKTLIGDLTPIEGTRVPGDNLVVGYYAQHQLEHLDIGATPFMHVQRLSPTASDLSIRNFLGGFGFRGDDVFGDVSRFSGGEKARLALSLVAWEKPNLLLLDEPTNHLDLDMREALAEALAEYEGAVIIVSHDRHLLRASVDTFWRVAEGRVEPFDGDLDDYHQWLKSRELELRRDLKQEARQEKGAADGGDRKAARRAAAERREQMKPLRKQRDTAEKKLDKAQSALTALEVQLADPDIYDAGRKDELARLVREQGERQAEVEQLESEWMAAEEALETLEAELLQAES
ncbi:ABC transporter ATP-binding protein [Salinicola sp. MH3R3-1]|uniref:ABC-F family ATP-binding cassette domain-containing protein n=1 Tax=Salinicola sp. MH3R3-1 TaxID=1928762 RepID=UPI00094EEA29|nr:ATP-binding cassette domain-containing protein [Salinicola sp. MH3R3-1]OLO06299.1 ABC transporter ATP-binding protein [Salinicola sp. MH3R3-1]